jgi:hypothetical protein
MAEHTRKTGHVRKNNPPKPRPLQPKESRRVNVTDPDSRPVKTATGFIQGYTAEAAATEGQVIVAAELITGANERARLEPMARAAEKGARQGGRRREARAPPRRRRLLQPPADRGARKGRDESALPARRRQPKEADEDEIGAPLRGDAKTASRTRGRAGLPAKTADDRAGLRPDQVATASRAVLTARVIRLPRRVASDGGDPQPLEALSGDLEPAGGLTAAISPRSSDPRRHAPAVSLPA